MPKVLCTLPNASDEISGVKFVTHAHGMLSEDISDDVAEQFAAIPGYEIVGGSTPAPAQVLSPAPVPETAQAPAPAADQAPAPDQPTEQAAPAPATAPAAPEVDEKAALAAEFEALGGKVKGNWGIDRLKAEVEAAKKAKSESDAA